MGIDYLPRPDRELSQWLRQFLAAAATRQARLGLSPGELALLRQVAEEWERSLDALHTLQQQAHAARAAKDALRRQGEKLIRQSVRQIQTRGTLSAADRVTLGIRVAKPRIGRAAAEAAPGTAPVLRVEALPQLHRLHFRDEATPRKKAKPPRVGWCELWRAVTPLDGGAPPAKAWGYLEQASATPHLVRCTAEQTGQRIWYRARWVSVRGVRGPWSNLVSAMVVE